MDGAAAAFDHECASWICTDEGTIASGSSEAMMQVRNERRVIGRHLVLLQVY